MAAAVEASLVGPGELRRVGKAIAAVAAGVGATSVVGASLVGERMATAAVIEGSGLRLWSPGGAERVLVVEGLVVAGAQIGRRVAQLLAEGCSVAGAVAYNRFGDPHVPGVTLTVLSAEPFARSA
jgi:hypothetical protein